MSSNRNPGRVAGYLYLLLGFAVLPPRLYSPGATRGGSRASR